MKACLPRILAPLAAASLAACAHSMAPAAIHHPAEAKAPAVAPANAAQDQAELDSQLAQLRSDARLDRRAAAVVDLTVLVRRWPDQLRSLEPEFVLEIVT